MSAGVATGGVLGRLGLADFEARPATTDSQRQTSDAFGFKWARRDTYESPAMRDAARAWLVARYCGGDPAVLDGWLAGGRKVILDAGCGAGFSGLLLFGERLRDHDYVGVDISAATDVARARFAEAGIPGEFVRHDLATLPVHPGTVDIVFSEGVLHHTDDPAAALAHLAGALVPGGLACFYVYARKSAIREFTDDYVRDRLAPMDDAAAWAALEPLTRLGVALGELDATITVPEDIALLGIPKGTYDLQRFFYWHVCKAYYRPEFTLDEMTHINFDWFRPTNCFRQTPEEVRGWCEAAGLVVETMRVEEAGITVVARRA
jgi:SAM-dependent methyltransferase